MDYKEYFKNIQKNEILGDINIIVPKQDQKQFDNFIDVAWNYLKIEKLTRETAN